MAPSKLADRMAAFEANIRENERHGFDSTTITFARRSSSVQALVSPAGAKPVVTAMEAKRRHTVASIPKKKVQFPGRLPTSLPLDDDALSIPEQKSVQHPAPPPAAAAKCRFYNSKLETKPAESLSKPPKRKSMPAYLLSSGISSAMKELQADFMNDDNEDADSQAPAAQAPAAVTEVMTYRGMLRLQQQQKKQARRATYFGGAIAVPSDIHGLNQVNNKIAPIPAYSNTSRTLSSHSLSSNSDSSDSDCESDDDEDEDEAPKAKSGTNKATFAAMSRSVNDLEHVQFSDTFKRVMVIDDDNADIKAKYTTEPAVKSSPEVKSSSAVAAASKPVPERIMIAAVDHSEASYGGSFTNNSDAAFDLGASLSSVVDCGGAYFEDHRSGTEFHPSYEQQRRMSMARERARLQKEHQAGGGAQKLHTGVSVKDRMAAFLSAK